MLNAKPEDVRVQSPLSKLRSSEHWDLPLQGWKRSLRNKVLSLDHKSRKIVRGRPVTSKTSPERVSQPRKTVDNNYAKQASHTKEKQRDDDGISLVVSDAQPKGGCQYKPLLANLKTSVVEVEVVIILKKGAEIRMIYFLIQKWNLL